MAKSGLKHIDVGAELTKTEWESEESHQLIHGSSFPDSPVERQLFYRDDEHKWYIYNGSDWVWLGGGSGGGMVEHGNEYHNPDFEQQGVAASLLGTHQTTAVHTQPQTPAAHKTAHQDGGSDEISLAGLDGEPSTLTTHKNATTGVHGVGAGTIAKVADIAVDSNLSSAAQDAIAKKHTQNTDKAIKDAAGSTALEVEQSAGEGKIRGKVKGVEAMLIQDVGIVSFAQQSAAKAYISADQSISGQAYVKINLNTTVYDRRSEFNTGTYKFTATEPGIYLIVGRIQMLTVTASKQLTVAIYKNEAIVTRNAIVQADVNTSCIVADAVVCAANDYLELYVYFDNAGTWTVYGGQESRTFMDVTKIA